MVGSGVDASQVGTGKTITTGRALAHRANTTRRFRALVSPRAGCSASGATSSPRRARPRAGAAGAQRRAAAARRPPIDRRQIRAFDRALGDRPGVVLAPNGTLDRHPAELEAIAWHLLIADEALRYANPATDAHQALAQVRMGCVADCWLLTATPRGKSAEQLDVLVGLAVGDEAMIRERLNTREAGDLLDELNAHRLRVNYGPHLVRVTRQDMRPGCPTSAPPSRSRSNPTPPCTSCWRRSAAAAARPTAS